MGIAFSIGFVIGPMIGVIFARVSASGERAEHWYAYPALFAFLLAVSDLVYVACYLEESLPVGRRAKSLRSGVSGAMTYINPVDLFQFNGVSGLTRQGKERYRQDNQRRLDDSSAMWSRDSRIFCSSIFYNLKSPDKCFTTFVYLPS